MSAKDLIPQITLQPPPTSPASQTILYPPSTPQTGLPFWWSPEHDHFFIWLRESPGIPREIQSDMDTVYKLFFYTYCIPPNQKNRYAMCQRWQQLRHHADELLEMLEEETGEPGKKELKYTWMDWDWAE